MTKEEEFLPSNHFIMEGKTILINQFSTQMEGDLVDVDIIFGVRGLDSKEIKWWDPANVGKPIWEESFDIYNPATQVAHLDLSKEILSKQNFIVEGSLLSWILEFQDYLQTPFEEGGSGRYFSIPIKNPESFKILFDEFITKWPKGIEMHSKGMFFCH